MIWSKATAWQRLRYVTEWILLVLAVSFVFLMCLPPGIMLAYAIMSALSWLK